MLVVDVFVFYELLICVMHVGLHRGLFLNVLCDFALF